MRAYVASLADQGTTLVLSPDSEFLKYLNSAQTGSGDTFGRAPAPPAAQPEEPTGAPAAPGAPANGG